MSEEKIIESLKNHFKNLKNRFNENPGDRKRYIILLLGGIFFLDYLMFCFHAEKNIFDIVPPLPLLQETREIALYLPSPDGKTILKEKRNIGTFSSDEKLVSVLLSMVLTGSISENTSMAVPVNLKLRRIWIHKDGGQCVIDIEPSVISGDIKIIKGSEELFRKSLEKTLKENVAGIKELQILERGVPGKKLWEM